MHLNAYTMLIWVPLVQSSPMVRRISRWKSLRRRSATRSEPFPSRGHGFFAHQGFVVFFIWAFYDCSMIFWLVVWNINFIFPYIGNNHPNWLSYFSEGWPNHQPVFYVSWSLSWLMMFQYASTGTAAQLMCIYRYMDIYGYIYIHTYTYARLCM